MKKMLALVVAILMLTALFAACTPEESPVPDEPSEAPIAVDESPAPEAQAPEETPAAAPQGDGSLERIKTQGYFIVGLDDAFPPMGYRDANDEIVGFDIDFARAAAQKMGVEVKFQPVVWDNIAQEVKSRNVDIIWNGCTITDERKAVFDFSKPYMLNKQVVVVLKDAPYQTLADLAGKRRAFRTVLRPISLSMRIPNSRARSRKSSALPPTTRRCSTWPQSASIA